ncbi:Druantia anti-phage system protein DruA [Methyloprofundus sp.]|uniref:Druantia anti-phage system protein DruA n=1 Tax=Methyloprofundus sp. TaxID=2020875 RepID=UPI003D0F0C08
MQLNQISVRPILKQEEPKYQDLMEAQHYLGAIPKIGETLWYVAYSETEWIALISFSAAALKCAARDSWIGSDILIRYPERNPLKLKLGNIIKGLGNYCQMIDIFS